MLKGFGRHLMQFSWPAGRVHLAQQPRSGPMLLGREMTPSLRLGGAKGIGNYFGNDFLAIFVHAPPSRNIRRV